MAQKSEVRQAVPGTEIEMLGGNNKERIGGNSILVKVANEEGKETRILFDAGALFTPYESGFEAAFPDMDDFFDRKDAKTGNIAKAVKPVSAIMLTHVHEDHIGALIHLIKMGYVLPPVKASRYTKNLISLSFRKEGLEPPQIDVVKPGDNILIGDDMIVEAYSVAHSVVDSLGFHTLTFVNGRPDAGILNNGDFLTESEMPVGRAFELDAVRDIAKRKLITHVLVDSTSTMPHGSERIGFDQAVENTLGVINANRGRDVILSPVISRSMQNLAIDIETARRLNTKICLDGKWLKLAVQAMQMSGYKDFDDIIYKGSIGQYLADKSIQKKYIVCTGAFAQGMEEYEKNQGMGNRIPMAAATKIALDLHKDIRLSDRRFDQNVLVLMRQRIIEDINGRTGPKMLQMMAAKGAKVVMSPCGKNVGDIEQVKMQDSGHLNAEALKKYAGNLFDFVAAHSLEKGTDPVKVTFISIHGNPEQCDGTRQALGEIGAETFIPQNRQIIRLGRNKTEDVTGYLPPQTWIAVKHLVFDPLKPDDSIPYDGRNEYWRIDENYMPIEKLMEYEAPKKERPGGRGYYANHPELEKFENSPMRDPMHRKGGKKTGGKKSLGFLKKIRGSEGNF